MLIGLTGTGGQEALTQRLLAEGHTVMQDVRFPMEAMRIKWAGGQVWQVGEKAWPVEADKVVQP